MKRPVFHDPDLQATFDRAGFVTLDLLDAAKRAELQELLAGIYRDSTKDNARVQSEYELSFFNKDTEYKRRVREAIHGFFAPLLDPILDDYEPLIVNLFNKVPGTGEVPIHQNWTFVDEAKYTSVSVWVPLCDVARVNGTLEVVPGTHRSLTPYRSPSIPWVFAGREDEIKEHLMEPLELSFGQVAILDDAILHYSGDNHSDADRGTIQLIMKPRGVQAIHYYCPDVEQGELEVFGVDSDFFAGFDMHARPEGAEVIDRVHFTYRLATDRELAPLA